VDAASSRLSRSCWDVGEGARGPAPSRLLVREWSLGGPSQRGLPRRPRGSCSVPGHDLPGNTRTCRGGRAPSPRDCASAPRYPGVVVPVSRVVALASRCVSGLLGIVASATRVVVLPPRVLSRVPRIVARAPGGVSGISRASARARERVEMVAGIGIPGAGEGRDGGRERRRGARVGRPCGFDGRVAGFDGRLAACDGGSRPPRRSGRHPTTPSRSAWCGCTRTTAWLGHTMVWVHPDHRLARSHDGVGAPGPPRGAVTRWCLCTQTTAWRGQTTVWEHPDHRLAWSHGGVGAPRRLPGAVARWRVHAHAMARWGHALACAHRRRPSARSDRAVDACVPG